MLEGQTSEKHGSDDSGSDKSSKNSFKRAYSTGPSLSTENEFVRIAMDLREKLVN